MIRNVGLGLWELKDKYFAFLIFIEIEYWVFLDVLKWLLAFLSLFLSLSPFRF